MPHTQFQVYCKCKICLSKEKPSNPHCDLTERNHDMNESKENPATGRNNEKKVYLKAII